MRKPLPPLNSLRSFEAVARQLSFRKAAWELHVTPGAVSQQIRALEDLLGAKLFDRTRRWVALTDTAARMLPDVQAGFDSLSRACGSNAAPVGERALTISVAPSFASKWLLPRLPGFYEFHPDIELRISATVGLADFKRDKVDLAIRLGHGRYPGLHAEPLFNEALTPLCSPGLLKRKGRLRTPDDLRKHRLVHDMSIPGGGDSAAWTNGWRLQAQSRFSRTAAPNSALPNSPCRRRSMASASCSGVSCWPRAIWQRVGWSAPSRWRCRWM